MNMQALMAQAKKLQGDLEKATKELESTEFNHEDENVLVTALGNNKITKIVVKNSDILEDKEILEDVLVVAVNDVLNKIKSQKDSKLGKYTGGLGGLF